jgi:hypothetical protein
VMSALRCLLALVVVVLVVAPPLHWAGGMPGVRTDAKSPSAGISWTHFPAASGPCERLVSLPVAGSATLFDVMASLPLFATIPFVPPKL